MQIKKNHGNSKAAWSNKLEAKERKLIRSEKKAKKRIAILKDKQEEEERKRRRDEELAQEWRELQEDARKLKKGRFEDL